MEENNISIFNNEVEPVELRLGSIPDVPLVKFNPPESDYEKNRQDRDKEISIFNAPDPVNNFSITENMGKISNTPTYATGTSRGVEDLSELSDYDVLTGESPYGSGKDDYMYRHQSTMEALGKTAWNAMSNFISGLTMTPSAAYSIADRNFGTDNPYENPLSAVSDWAQEKKYRVWGKDGQLDLSDALGVIEQIPMTLGIMGGTVATLAPAAFVGAELGLGAVAGASLGFGVTVGEVGSAIAMAYAEGRDGARGTFKEKYNQIYKETGNDEYAKRIAEYAASVETNTNILLNTALNIIPAKWLLKNNKLKTIDDVLEDTGLLNKYKPYQLADESLEEFTARMKNFTSGTKTNLNRDALDFTGKMSDLAYNVKNPGEFLNRKLDIVGEIFGEGLEEYNNYYAHELAMSINSEKDVQKLNGVLSVPLSQIGNDITDVKILKDMTNNKGLYDFASGAIVSALTSPFMKKFKLNRSKVYNEETGEYEYKYKRSDSNPFKNIPYFEYQNSDYDALDVEQQALNSLKTIDQMNGLVESYNNATDMDIKDSYIQQMTNIPLSKHLNQKTINVYNALLDNQIKGLGEKNKSIVNDDALIDTVSKGLDTSMYSYISAQQKAKLEGNVKKYKDVSALIAEKTAKGEDVATHEAEKTGFLKEIKDIGSVASKAINKHQTELKTQLDYSKNLAKEYNETIEYFTKQGVTRDNDYGFVNAYFLNKINNKEESKLHDKVLQKYNTLQKEIIDELIKKNINNYKTKQDAYELLKKKEEILSDEIDKKEKEVAKLISRSDPNDTIYIDTLTAEINTAKAELTDLRTKEANGKTRLENLVISALKDLSNIQSKALSENKQLMEYGDNLTKSRIRLRQYEIENKHLTDSSYGDATDTILQKLHMKIQAHRNGDDLLSAISKYEQISKIIEASGIAIDPLELGSFTDEEKETLRRHKAFNEYVLEYEDIVDKNQGNKQGHYLSKYFKANKRFVDELEKYEKSKEEVQYYHRQLYRLSETGDINYYAEFMSIFSNLQRYINEDGNIYNLGKDDMKKAIDKYNLYYQDALNYIDKLEQHYKDLQATDGVSRKMFTDRTESLKYFIMSKTKEIERLSEMYNYKLSQDTQKELSDLYKTIKTNYNSATDKATLKASIELQLSSYKRYISNYDKVIDMLVNNKDKSDYYDITAVDSATHYHKYGTYDIYTAKFIEYNTTTNKFEEKEVYRVNDVDTKLTLIKLDDAAPLLFTNQDNLLLTDELKNIKTRDTVANDYMFVDSNNNEITYKDLKDFESIEEKLDNALSTNLIDIDGTIYYKDVTADYYKIIDNKGELISKDDIIANHSITAPFHLYTPTKSVFLIKDKIYTSNGTVLSRNPDTQFYSITDATTKEIKIFTIKNIVDDKLTIEVNYGVNATKNEVIPFSQDIIPTPSKDDVDYIKGMIDFIDEQVDATGKFDYAKYKSENEGDPVHKAIIDLVEELMSNNGVTNFYLHTINNKLIFPYIDIIRSSKLSSLIKLVNNDIDKDYPSKIDFTTKVTNTGRLLFNQEIKESNYANKIDDYIKTINLPNTKKDTQLLDNVLDDITARLTALKAITWKKDIVYDLYQILKDYNDLVKDPLNLKVSYKFENKGDIYVNTTINLIEGSDIVIYKYINHKYILTDTGLKVEVMYTTNGVDVSLDDKDIVNKINTNTVRPIILTLNVGKNLKTTPETLNRITVKNDTITSIPLNSNNLQHNHSFELFTNNGDSKMLIIKGKQVNINKATNPSLFDSTSLNQDRKVISSAGIIQLKRLIALFSIDTDGNSVDVYNDIFGGVINDSIISAFINTTFGSKDVFERIAIDADKVTFTRKITADVVVDTVNGVEYKYPIEKPIINTGATGSSTIVPENIISETIEIIDKIGESIIDTNDEFLKLQKQITEITYAKNKLIEKAIGDIRGVVKIPNYRLNINENSTLYAQRYVEDKDTWENYNVEAKTIIDLFGAKNWKVITDIHNAFYKEFRTNGYAKKEAAIEKQQFDLLSTPTGLELRRAWSFGKIDEPSILKLTATEYIILEEENGNDIYIGYYYLPTNESNIRAEEVTGDSIQEVKDKINAKYDAELVELNLKKEQLTLSSIDALKANIENRRDIDLTKEITGLETTTEFDNNPVVININNKYDKEYLKAVDDKKITKIEALQVLISVNRKGSDTYNKLLKDLVQEKINEAMTNQKGDVTYLIKNNDKIISTDSLNDIDIAYDITIEITVLPPVDLSIIDEFDMLLEEPYEYISEALLNKNYPTVADNSNHHKESLRSSVLNTNTDIDYRVPIDINYTITHSEEHKEAYKKGLYEKLHNNTGINNVTLEVLPVTISYSENGKLTVPLVLNTKKEQYDFYYEMFSKSSVSETALKGYLMQMRYNLLDSILDSDGKPLFGFEFSNVAANKEKIINFLANLKINYVFMNEDNTKIYGSLHDYAYLLAKDTRVETIDAKAISSLKILRDTAQQHEDDLANGVQSNKPIYRLSYEDNGYIRIFKDFSTTPPPFTERDNLYYNSKIALAHQKVEPFKIYLSRTKADTDRILKYNQDDLTLAVEDMNEEELVSIYRLLLYKANKVLKLYIPLISIGEKIDSNTLNTWIIENLMPKISGNFIIYGAKITNNISKEKSHIPLYTIKFKELLPSSELTIDDKFVGDAVKIKVGDTKKEILNYHNNLTQTIENINLTEIRNIKTDKDTVLDILSNFANIDIVFKDVDTWAKKLANSPFEGTSIAVFNSHTTDELTLYLYSNIKNEKGENVKTLTSISYKQGSKPLVNNRTYMSSINEFAKPDKIVLQPSQLLEKFMNAYLSADVTADNSNENILLRTITHVNGLNDELFVNPLLKIEDTIATKTVVPIIVTTDNSNTSDIELPTELLAIQGLIDLYEEFMVEEKRKDKSYVVSSGFSTTIKPHNEVAEKIEDIYELIQNNKEIKTLVSNYKSFINNIINKKEPIDITTIHDITGLKLFVKKGDIYYINGRYNSNDLNSDIETLKSFKIDKDITDCK